MVINDWKLAKELFAKEVFSGRLRYEGTLRQRGLLWSSKVRRNSSPQRSSLVVLGTKELFAKEVFSGRLRYEGTLRQRGLFWSSKVRVLVWTLDCHHLVQVETHRKKADRVKDRVLF